jgi:hypothetical protein
MWCVPELDAAYIKHMEDVLNLLAAPPKEDEPVVALDERPVQLHDDVRPGRRSAPGKIGHRDHEYLRCGTANVFCIMAPKTGRHFTHATENRKAPQFARAMKRIADGYPEAKIIHMIMDQLNTHCEKSLHRAFGLEKGRRLWKRFKVHYTPKHGSWLDPAEIEASLWSRECLAADRIPTLAELQHRTRKWNQRADRARRKISWRFTTADARRVFKYRPGTTRRSEH